MPSSATDQASALKLTLKRQQIGSLLLSSSAESSAARETRERTLPLIPSTGFLGSSRDPLRGSGSNKQRNKNAERPKVKSSSKFNNDIERVVTTREPLSSSSESFVKVNELNGLKKLRTELRKSIVNSPEYADYDLYKQYISELQSINEGLSGAKTDPGAEWIYNLWLLGVIIKQNEALAASFLSMEKFSALFLKRQSESQGPISQDTSDKNLVAEPTAKRQRQDNVPIVSSSEPLPPSPSAPRLSTQTKSSLRFIHLFSSSRPLRVSLAILRWLKLVRRKRIFGSFDFEERSDKLFISELLKDPSSIFEMSDFGLDAVSETEGKIRMHQETFSDDNFNSRFFHLDWMKDLRSKSDSQNSNSQNKNNYNSTGKQFGTRFQSAGNSRQQLSAIDSSEITLSSHDSRVSESFYALFWILFCRCGLWDARTISTTGESCLLSDFCSKTNQLWLSSAFIGMATADIHEDSSFPSCGKDDIFELCLAATPPDLLEGFPKVPDDNLPKIKEKEKQINADIGARDFSEIGMISEILSSFDCLEKKSRTDYHHENEINQISLRTEESGDSKKTNSLKTLFGRMSETCNPTLMPFQHLVFGFLGSNLCHSLPSTSSLKFPSGVRGHYFLQDVFEDVLFAAVDCLLQSLLKQSPVSSASNQESQRSSLPPSFQDELTSLLPTFLRASGCERRAMADDSPGDSGGRTRKVRFEELRDDTRQPVASSQRETAAKLLSALNDYFSYGDEFSRNSINDLLKSFVDISVTHSQKIISSSSAVQSLQSNAQILKACLELWLIPSCHENVSALLFDEKTSDSSSRHPADKLMVRLPPPPKGLFQTKLTRFQLASMCMGVFHLCSTHTFLQWCQAEAKKDRDRSSIQQSGKTQSDKSDLALIVSAIGSDQLKTQLECSVLRLGSQLSWLVLGAISDLLGNSTGYSSDKYKDRSRINTYDMSEDVRMMDTDASRSSSPADGTSQDSCSEGEEQTGRQNLDPKTKRNIFIKKTSTIFRLFVELLPFVSETAQIEMLSLLFRSLCIIPQSKHFYTLTNESFIDSYVFSDYWFDNSEPVFENERDRRTRINKHLSADSEMSSFDVNFIMKNQLPSKDSTRSRATTKTFDNNFSNTNLLTDRGDVILLDGLSEESIIELLTHQLSSSSDLQTSTSSFSDILDSVSADADSKLVRLFVNTCLWSLTRSLPLTTQKAFLMISSSVLKNAKICSDEIVSVFTNSTKQRSAANVVKITHLDMMISHSNLCSLVSIFASFFNLLLSTSVPADVLSLMSQCSSLGISDDSQPSDSSSTALMKRLRSCLGSLAGSLSENDFANQLLQSPKRKKGGNENRDMINIDNNNSSTDFYPASGWDDNDEFNHILKFDSYLQLCYLNELKYKLGDLLLRQISAAHLLLELLDSSYFSHVAIRKSHLVSQSLLVDTTSAKSPTRRKDSRFGSPPPPLKESLWGYSVRKKGPSVLKKSENKENQEIERIRREEKYSSLAVPSNEDSKLTNSIHLLLPVVFSNTPKDELGFATAPKSAQEETIRVEVKILPVVSSQSTTADMLLSLSSIKPSSIFHDVILKSVVNPMTGFLESSIRQALRLGQPVFGLSTTSVDLSLALSSLLQDFNLRVFSVEFLSSLLNTVPHDVLWIPNDVSLPPSIRNDRSDLSRAENLMSGFGATRSTNKLQLSDRKITVPSVFNLCHLRSLLMASHFSEGPVKLYKFGALASNTSTDSEQLNESFGELLEWLIFALCPRLLTGFHPYIGEWQLISTTIFKSVFHFITPAILHSIPDENFTQLENLVQKFFAPIASSESIIPQSFPPLLTMLVTMESSAVCSPSKKNIQFPFLSPQLSTIKGHFASKVHSMSASMSVVEEVKNAKDSLSFVDIIDRISQIMRIRNETSLAQFNNNIRTDPLFQLRASITKFAIWDIRIALERINSSLPSELTWKPITGSTGQVFRQRERQDSYRAEATDSKSRSDLSDRMKIGGFETSSYKDIRQKMLVVNQLTKFFDEFSELSNPERVKLR